MTADISSNRRYWLLTSPRTASNLLVRILNLEEQGTRPALRGGYFFLSKVMGQAKLYSKPAQEWTPEQFASIDETARNCFNNLQDYVEAATESGEKIFVKEHVFFLNSLYAEAEYLGGGKIPRPVNAVEPMRGLTHATQSPLNLTCLPDEFLKTWHPTFLIRHPAAVLPSLYRTAQRNSETADMVRQQSEPFEIEASSRFARTLYDFYREHFGRDSQWPIVLDADDIMTSPDLITKYAGLVDLDPSKLQFSWERVSKEAEDKMGPLERIMFGTINSSTGVDKGKVAGDVDIDAEIAKWRSEFGKGSEKLERWVREGMPDYEYLHARRLRVDLN
ncbi:hypothetical protein F4861DRAFT_251539 [Xylaria intraflava]|nr:hypothetical protein F4861DRAFT_251539 [Xylaria intraflava]